MCSVSVSLYIFILQRWFLPVFRLKFHAVFKEPMYLYWICILRATHKTKTLSKMHTNHNNMSKMHVIDGYNRILKKYTHKKRVNEKYAESNFILAQIKEEMLRMSTWKFYSLESKWENTILNYKKNGRSRKWAQSASTRLVHKN